MRYRGEVDPATFLTYCVYDTQMDGPVETGFDSRDAAWGRAHQLNRGPKPRYEVRKTFGYGMDENTYWTVVDFWTNDAYADHFVPKEVERFSSQKKATLRCEYLNENTPPVRGIKVRAAALRGFFGPGVVGEHAAFVKDVLGLGDGDVTQKAAVLMLVKWLRAHHFDHERLKSVRERMRAEFPALYLRVLEKYVDSLGGLLL